MNDNNNKMSDMFKPTKTWFKNHNYKPVECQNVDCVCILDHFNHNHQGYCVGYQKSGNLAVMFWAARPGAGDAFHVFVAQDRYFEKYRSRCTFLTVHLY